MDFEQLAVAPDHSPEWLRAFHAASRSRLAGVPWPDRKTEAWRNTSLRPLSAVSFETRTNTANTEGGGDPRQYQVEGLNSMDLVFVDGRFESMSSELPDGVTMVQFAEVDGPVADDVRRRLGSVVPAGQHFAQLNGSRLDNGILLRVHGTVTQPVRVIWQTTGPGALNHRLFVEMEEGSDATLIEHFCGIGDVFTNSVSEFDQAPGSRLRHYRLHLEDEAALHIGGCHTRLAANASLSSFHLGTGGPLKRLDVTVDHAGPGSTSQLAGAYLPRSDQRIDYHVCVEHSEPQGDSQSVFRGIVADNARAVFNGRIHIHPGASKTSATLDNKNLLTSAKAQVDTKPELEIYNDDVACAHGATVSRLSGEALHYLRSRGIGTNAAYRMLNFAFINELLDHVSEPALGDYLRTQLHDWFGQVAL